MARNRMQSVVIGAVTTLALAAAVYTLQASRGGGSETIDGVATNLQTSNAGAAQSIAHALVGKPAPSLSLPDLEGSGVSLDAYRGKRVILSFWTSW